MADERSRLTYAGTHKGLLVPIKHGTVKLKSSLRLPVRNNIHLVSTFGLFLLALDNLSVFFNPELEFILQRDLNVCFGHTSFNVLYHLVFLLHTVLTIL